MKRLNITAMRWVMFHPDVLDEGLGKSGAWGTLLASSFHAHYAADHGWWMDSLCARDAKGPEDPTRLEVISPFTRPRWHLRCMIPLNEIRFF
jgi:hypothetical protein